MANGVLSADRLGELDLAQLSQLGAERPAAPAQNSRRRGRSGCPSLVARRGSSRRRGGCLRRALDQLHDALLGLSGRIRHGGAQHRGLRHGDHWGGKRALQKSLSLLHV